MAVVKKFKIPVQATLMWVFDGQDPERPDAIEADEFNLRDVGFVSQAAIARRFEEWYARALAMPEVEAAGVTSDALLVLEAAFVDAIYGGDMPFTPEGDYGESFEGEDEDVAEERKRRDEFVALAVAGQQYLNRQEEGEQ